MSLELDEETTAPPAAHGSPLFNLRAAKDARKAKLYVDLAVPRWADSVDGQPGTRLCIRCEPVGQQRMERLTRKFDKRKDPGKNLDLNAAIIAEFTLGLFVVVEVDGAEVKVAADPDAEDPTEPSSWPRFDDALAASLDLPAALPAVQLVKEVFYTDGDLIATAQQLTQWSGYVLGEAAQDDLDAGN